MGYNNSYTDIHGSWTDSADNSDIDPQFVRSGHWDDNGIPADDSDDVWVDGDYHLTELSACVDAGLPTAPEMPTVDFEGDPRAVDGNNDGAADPDMGADEVAIACIADMEADGDVDATELIAVAAAYGAAMGDSSYNPDADVDGVVDDRDLAVVADEFGRINCI